MHNDQPGIATIELAVPPCWNVAFRCNVLLSVADINWLYQYIRNKGAELPVLMDWRGIQGIEFEALEQIVRFQSGEHPLTIIAEPCSIGERYAHLINQLCEQNCSCVVFPTAPEAVGWLSRRQEEEP